MKHFTILLVLAITFASCTHVYYAPNTANAPLLSEKGETRINGLITGGGVSEFSGGELQVAHAITNNFAVMINGMSVSRSDEVGAWDWGGNGTHTEKGKGSYLEFSGGYFKNLDNSKKFLFETYGGVGLGSANNDYGFSDYSKVNIFKLFVQPSFAFKSTYFEMAFTPKLSFVNWNVKENHVSGPDGSYNKASLATIEKRPSFVALEPALVLRAGGKNVKFQTAISLSNVRSNNSSQISDLIENTNLSFGISVNLKPKKK